MSNRYRKKPLATFEHGTRIYAPSPAEPRFRVVGTDRVTGERLFFKLTSEELARAKAREIEQFLTEGAAVRSHGGEGPRTVGRLAEAYVERYLADKSVRYRERQECLLRVWVLPTLADRPVTQWTSAESEAVLAAARGKGRSPALVQDVGAVMRALVTYARRLRWLTSQSPDPMWLVSYSKKSILQGQSALYVPRAGLPTDEQCDHLFAAMEQLGEPQWALAMRLTHRSGLRWGELIALQPRDVIAHPARVIQVRRAVEQPAAGPPTMKLPKNGRIRTTISRRASRTICLSWSNRLPRPQGLRAYSFRVGEAGLSVAPCFSRFGLNRPTSPAGR